MQERLLKFEDKTSIFHPEANVKKKTFWLGGKTYWPLNTPRLFFLNQWSVPIYKKNTSTMYVFNKISKHFKSIIYICIMHWPLNYLHHLQCNWTQLVVVNVLINKNKCWYKKVYPFLPLTCSGYQLKINVGT